MQLRPLFRLSEGLHDFQYIGFANSPQEFRLPAGYLGGLLFARAHKELVPFVKIFAWGDGEQTALYARFGDLCFMLDRSRIHFYAARDGEAGRAELADSPLVQVMFEAIAAAPAQGSLPRLAFLELLRFGPEALRRIALDATNRADHAFTERVRDRCDAARAAVTALAGNGAELGNIVSAIGGEVEAQQVRCVARAPQLSLFFSCAPTLPVSYLNLEPFLLQELGLALATCAAEIGEVVSQLNFNLAAADTGRAGGGGPWLKIFTSLIKNDPWGFALASAMYFPSASWLPPSS
jgi:hypothetical protein